MKIKIFKNSLDRDSFTERYYLNELVNRNIYLTDEFQADIIITSSLKEMMVYILKYGSQKKYCVWCDEPLWTNLEFQPPLCRKRYYCMLDGSGRVLDRFIPGTVPVEMMNCYTGDIFFNNHHFINSGYLINQSSLKEIFKNKRKLFTNNLKPEDKRLIAFQSFRVGDKWEFKSEDLHTHSLNNLRSKAVLDGALQGFIDVYGPDWPEIPGLIKGNSRFSDNPWSEKINIMKNYFFSVCFENSVVDNYVTEKIWHGILAGTLPIYYAGSGHTIYRDFARNSFIDFADFKDIFSCWEYICRMEQAEYENRMRLCIESLETALHISNKGKVPRELQLTAIVGRLQSIHSQSIATPVSTFVGGLNWRLILQNECPVILDIGANDGGTSASFFAALPQARIFAFEPDPRAIKRFKSRRFFSDIYSYSDMVNSAKLSLYEGVVSATTGSLDFYQSDGVVADTPWFQTGWDLSGSIKKPSKHLVVHPQINFNQKIKVPSTTIDQWIADKDIGVIDLAWIDVQGAEQDVIKGAKNTLSCIRYLYLEYSEDELYEGQLGLKELLSLLPNFEVVQVFADDVLLVNKSLKSV